MKKCSKCGSLNADDAATCRSCAAGPESLLFESGPPSPLRDRFGDFGGVRRLVQIAVVAAVLGLPIAGGVLWNRMHPAPEPPRPPDRPASGKKTTDIPPPPVKPGEVFWRISAGGPVHAPACAADGRVFVASYRGVVTAIDSETGKPVWCDAFVEDVAAPPAVDGGVLYVAGNHGDLAAVEAATGEKIWKTSGWSEIAAGPSVQGDRLILATTDGMVRALSTKDGSTRWTFKAGDAVRGTPVVDAESVTLASEAGVVFRLNVADGAPIWRFDAKSGILAPLAAQGGRVIAATLDGAVISIEDGREAKRWTAGGPIRAAPALDGGRIFVAAGRALIRLDGWRLDTGDVIESSPAVSADRVYFGSHDKKLRCVDAESGREIWTVPFDWYVTASPIVYRGRVLFGGTDGKALSVQTDRPDGPDWPQFGGGASRGGYNRGRRE